MLFVFLPRLFAFHLEEHVQAEILEQLMMAGQCIGFGRCLAILRLEDVACPQPAS